MERMILLTLFVLVAIDSGAIAEFVYDLFESAG